MAIDASQILELAEKLFDTEKNECGARSAISRAYYAALHISMEAVPDEFEINVDIANGMNSHQRVIDAMTRWGNSITPGRTNARQAARLLSRLKHARVKADYYLQDESIYGQAEFHLTTAKTIIAHMDPYRQSEEQINQG
jgi:hypothetical protein